MRKYILLSIIICCGFFVNAQGSENTRNDFGLSRTNIKIAGIYIFMDSDPINTYFVLETIKVKLKDGEHVAKQLEKAIKRGKKEYSNLNGIIIRNNKYHQADLITFDKVDKSLQK